MRRFFSLVSRFGRDESGIFGVLFGLMAIVIVALSGAVVDYVAMDQARNRGQIALDAAALSLQPLIFNTTVSAATIQSQAQALVVDRIGDNRIGPTVVVGTPTINRTDGSLLLTATYNVPTLFVNLVGVTRLDVRIQSEATRKKLALEIAFVMDNSGSMQYTGAGSNGTRQRIQFLKDAANCATNILFYKDVVDSTTNPDTCVPVTGATKLDDVKIGVVPFTMFVNVGNGNAGASWIDKGSATNSSVTNNDNFDDGRTPPGTINRATLFAATGQNWKGCIEARPHIKTGSTSTEYLDTDDTLPVSGNTLFVPMFSPDIADDVGTFSATNNYMADSSDQPAVCDRPATLPIPTTCTITDRRTGCNSTMTNTGCTTTFNFLTAMTGPTNFTSSAIYPNAYYGAHSPSCGCRNPTVQAWIQTAGSNNNRTFERVSTCLLGYTPTGLTTRQQQERICKYYGNVTGTSATRGPNADCGDASITPLTATPATVTSAINAMVALGGTNIHEGAAWGFRLLSPGAPFTEGAAYSESTSKVMILMTDGENTTYNLSNPNYCNSTSMRAFNGSCFNSAYGYQYNSKNNDSSSSSGGNIERLGSASLVNNAALVTEMNARTVQTCANAKAAGITVYTIGLATSEASQSTQAVVEQMLTDCASTEGGAYFPQTPGELKSVFQEIANQLTSLRLAR